MATENSNSQAQVTQVKTVSRMWLIPIIAAAVGIWIVYIQISTQGPLITIELNSADGLEVDKTKIKARSLDVGVIKQIELKPDLSGVIVTARMNANTDHLLTENTQFWLVTPRISLSGVSGLNTLLSGTYIAMDPSEDGQSQSVFVALEDPPVTPPGTPGLHITLNSDDEFAFEEGDPIIYKGMKVGDFEDIYFNIEERVVYYNAFIEAPYHKLITENTRFWNTSGVSFNLTANGIQVQASSLETLLTNGVTFDVPEGMPAGQQITKRAYFDIYPNYEAASNARFKLAAEYVLLIEDTVRGLNPGAPVEYRGIQVGEVHHMEIGEEAGNFLLSEEFNIPLLVKIYPGRVQLPDNQDGLRFVQEQMTKWINRDLRATLRVGNVLTGALYVDLQHVPDSTIVQPAQFQDYEVIPTETDEFTQITQKLTAILDKINGLPLESMVNTVEVALIDMSNAAAAVETASTDFNSLIEQMDMQSINSNLNATLGQMESLLRDYSAGSVSNTEINNSMIELQRTLKSLQPVLHQLKGSPNSFIFSGQQDVKHVPKAQAGNKQGIFDE